MEEKEREREELGASLCLCHRCSSRVEHTEKADSWPRVGGDQPAVTGKATLMGDVGW